MNDTEIWELRAKQDRLIELIEEKRFSLDLRISAMDAGSPTGRQLLAYIYPQWEDVIDRQIRWIEGGAN